MSKNKKTFRRNNQRDKFYKDGKSDDKKDFRETEHKFNDVSWYTKNEQMLRDAASYSYNNPIGVNVPISISSVNLATQLARAVPSIMGLQVMPCIGLSTDASSPANLAANNIYAYVRYMNSGSKNYDQADLMLYLIAMDSLYACWNWMKRIYAYAQDYSQYNRTMPRAMAVVDNVNYSDILNNLADFRLFLNQTAASITSFCVPAVMPFFIRHSWMFSNIYKDSDNNKAQMYMFTPAGFYRYEETATPNGGSLRFMSTSNYTNPTGTNTPWTFKTLSAYMRNLLNAVAYSEDIGVMSGDILKAYGQEKLFKLSPVAETESVWPVYNEEVLNQIHNMGIVPYNTNVSYTKATDFDITQDPNTGYLIWSPNAAMMSSASSYYLETRMINMPWDDVTPANTMVGTRLTAMYATPDGGKAKLTACGTEIVTAAPMYLWNPDSNAWVVLDAVPGDFIRINTAEASAMQIIAYMTAVTQFDWHPLKYIVGIDTSGSSAVAVYQGVLGDVTNYTTMSLDDLTKLHGTAVMSEFNIPQLGSF